MSKKTDIKWTKEEDAIILKYGTTMNRTEMQERYFPYRSLSSVQNRCNQLKVSRSRELINETQQAWNDEDIQFLKDNLQTMTNRQIGEKINRTRSAVQNKINELGLKRDDKYNFNHKAFSEVNNQDVAYWLGFIYADGFVYINKNRSCELGIEIAKRDYEHLKKFNKFLNGNLNVKYRKRYNYDDTNRYSEYANIRLYSKQIVIDLQKYGIVQNKTYVSNENVLQYIPNEFKMDFIRGFLDGDGWIRKDRKRFGMCGVNLNLLKGIQQYLSELEIDSRISVISKSDKKINIRGREYNSNLDVFKLEIKSKNFGELLYHNATTYLDRKYNIYNDL